MTEPSRDVAGFIDARARVLARIAAAAERVGRDPAAVQLIAVSKTVDAVRVQAAVDAGFTVLGENRVQEGLAKAPSVHGARWALIGPLQSNKARKAIEVFDTIQSVDSVGLAERLDRLAREVHGSGPADRYPVLLQVNVDDDPAKAGFAPDDLPDVLRRLAALDALDVRGLMTIGRLVASPEAARTTFQGLRELAAGLRDDGLALGPDLSMGMTDDFEVAVEEGATIVRVGRALFGERGHDHDHRG